MPTQKTFSAFQQALTAGTTSVCEAVEEFLGNIAAGKALNVFLEVYAEEAKTRAAEIDQKLKDGTAGPLAGMVIALKDTLCHQGHVVSASSKILDDFESLFSATAVERLLAADAIIIGRTNCDEFAMGSSNENSAFGPVLNPLDATRVPGGSSGGSAAAVAANFCHAALGSDTGGSIRQPASFCGVVGVRPTYGRISRHGLLAFASSFDQIGTLTHNIEDAALLLEVISGGDEWDATVSHQPVDHYLAELPDHQGRKLRIGIVNDAVEHQGVNPILRDKIKQLAIDLRQQGHTIGEASFPYVDYVVPAYYVLATAEASSNLSRYAGMTYGYRSQNAHNLETTITLSRTEGFGPEVKRRIMLGTFVLSEGYYDAYYEKAQKVRRVIRNHTDEQLREYDILLLPTSPSTAFPFGKNADPISMYLEDIFTIQTALTGHPSLSVPFGTDGDGLPFGLQIIAPRFGESLMLGAAKLISDLSLSNL